MKLLRSLSLLVIVSLVISSPVFAANISSSNYVLLDPEMGDASGTTSSSNYDTLISPGNGIEYSQVSSSLYKLGTGHGYTFTANVPSIDCFETTTTSSNTQCTGLPNSNGMVGECGEGGCYDRAMVQIDEEGNPSETLFLIEFTRDNWNTIYVVDGTTHALKSESSKSIADYKTIANWEAAPWNSTNVIDLAPNVEYKVRSRALHGDFTESAAGPSDSATTALPTAVFDLDVGTQFTDENNGPYRINLGTLTPGIEKFSTNYIKIDFSTNARDGVEIFVRDQYDGLKSSTVTYTLDSANEDLASGSAGDGYGLQFVNATQDSGSNGNTVSGSTYVLSGSNVGAVSSSVNTRILCSMTSSSSTCSTGTPTWILNGKGMYKIGAKASLNAIASSDYQDTLTFTLTGNW